MAIQLNHETPADAELIGSRIGRIDPDNFQNQSDDTEEADTDDKLDDELIDKDGDPNRRIRLSEG